MKLNTAVIVTVFALSLIACSGKDTPTAASGTPSTPVTVEASASPPAVASADPLQDKGIGPITSLTLGPVDPALAKTGEEAFKTKCTACHKMDKRRVGPALADVTKRRSPEWIMNMIMNPAEMLEKDPIAKELLAEYSTQMADQNISESEARAILEYLRTKSTP